MSGRIDGVATPWRFWRKGTLLFQDSMSDVDADDSVKST